MKVERQEAEGEAMKKRNEQTGPRAARIAGRVLKHFNTAGVIDSDHAGVALALITSTSTYFAPIPGFTVAELKTLCASALTQAPTRSARNL